MNRNVLLAAAALVGLLVTAGLAPAQPATATSAPAAQAAIMPVGAMAPWFALKDQNGNTVDLADYRDKVVVLEWVNPTCPFDKRLYEFKTMWRLDKMWKDQGVVHFAINSTAGQTARDDAGFAGEYDVAYPILDDHDGLVGRAYGVKAATEMIVIDHGRIVYDGAVDNDPAGNWPYDQRLEYVNLAVQAVLTGEPVAIPRTKPYGCPIKYAELPVGGQVGDAAPDFSLESDTGQTCSLADVREGIAVLEWINPGCPIATRHYKAQTMKMLAIKYAPAGVRWLAIDSTHDVDNAGNLAWSKRYRIFYPALNDQSGKVGMAYGAKATPHMFILRNGVVVYNGAIDNNPDGTLPAGEVVNYVDQTLGELLSGLPVSIPQTKPYGCSIKYAQSQPASAATGGH